MTIGVIFAVLAVLGWLVWTRWLSHREMMLLTEGGQDARAALGLRERWRVRHGVLWAVRVLALGVALVIVAWLASDYKVPEVVSRGGDTAVVAVDGEELGGEEGEDAEAGREHPLLKREERVVRHVQVLGPEPMLLLIGAAAFLLLFGTVTLIAYVVWSRRDVEVLALGLLGDDKKIAPDAGEDGEEPSGAGEETEGETRG
jgi:hypothetical protein